MFLLKTGCTPSDPIRSPRVTSFSVIILASHCTCSGADVTSLAPSSTTARAKFDPAATSACGGLKRSRTAPGGVPGGVGGSVVEVPGAGGDVAAAPGAGVVGGPPVGGVVIAPCGLPGGVAIAAPPVGGTTIPGGSGGAVAGGGAADGVTGIRFAGAI